MRLRLLAIGLAAIVMPASTAAQDGAGAQTPENAQRFLAQMLPNQWTFELVGRGTQTVTRISSPTPSADNCATNYRLRYGDGREGNGILWWKGTGDIRHTQGSSIVSVYSNQQPYIDHLDFISPATAARAAFAMEFLRQHCDPAAGTGF